MVGRSGGRWVVGRLVRPAVGQSACGCLVGWLVGWADGRLGVRAVRRLVSQAFQRRGLGSWSVDWSVQSVFKMNHFNMVSHLHPTH